MASIADTALRLIARGALLAACCAAFGQTNLSTREAAARRKPDFAPTRLGQYVRVEGVVSGPPIAIAGFYQVAIEQDGYGLVLETPRSDSRLSKLEPGVEIEAVGHIAVRGGLPVLAVEELCMLGRTTPPEPVPLSIPQLQGNRHLGRLVVTEGRVLEVTANTGGEVILIGDRRHPYKLFLPRASGQREAAFVDFWMGDKVRATGIASQYCPAPPFDHWYQLTIAQPGDVVRLRRGLPIPPRLLVMVLGTSLIVAISFVRRERRLRQQRRMLRRAYQLAEEVLGASSSAEIARKTAGAMPLIFGASRAQLYLFNVGSKALEKVPASPEEEAASIDMASPREGAEAGVAACFQNRTLLAVPDMSRSPFSPPGGPAPRACLFVPMMAQGETAGVLELDQDNRLRIFGADEQALAQHLGNQIGLALRLLDQRSVREQLFRTEKLAAMGRLISSVVNELQAPLSSIRNLADHAVASGRQGKPPEHWGRDLEAVSEEAGKAREIVRRLMAFAGAEQAEARPVNLSALVRDLAEFREREWKSRGIRVRALISDEPLSVLGSQGQLEEVLLALIVHAEQALAEAPDKMINIRTTRLARHAVVEISYSGARGGPDPFETAENAGATLSLGICRGIIASHGGELRAIQASGADPRFEVELPLTRHRPAAAHDARARDLGRTMTALAIEPDDAVQNHLLTLLSARGYRVVPVQHADAGLELAQRLRFDVVFCSARAPGLNWVELSERLQAYVGGFVLLGEGYDPELAADFEGEDRFVLSKPIDEQRFDEILERVEGTLKSRGAVG